MYQYAGKLMPARIRRSYKNLLRYCDIQINADSFVGTFILLGFVIGLVVAFNLMIFFSLEAGAFAIIFLAIFLLTQVVGYMWLALRADAKGKFIENILPDALLLMAMNIKSGMTTDGALIMTARPEFGPLEKELNKAGKQVLAGKEIKYALLEMTYNVRSKQFERTMRLIIEGIESGGELSDLLKQTAEDMQNVKLVQDEVRAAVLMYAIFIFFAAGIGAPLLFGISTYLVGTIGQQFSVFQITGLTQQPITERIQISSDFLIMFAVISLTITSFFGGLIIGIVKNGQEKDGVKLIPMLFTVSMLVFFLVRAAVSSVFPGIGVI